MMLGLNQQAVEALYSASYVENYLDCVENLPDDVQRSVTQLRELDQKYQETLEELNQYQEVLQKELDVSSRKRTLLQMQRALIQSQEIGDEKIEILQQIQDLVENKSRQLELDYKNLDIGHETEAHTDPSRSDAQQPERASKRSRRQRQHEAFLRDDLIQDRPEKEPYIDTGNLKKKKKKKRKSKAESSPVEPPIDPDEPTYCLCEQVSFGEMIGCDNQECPIEWFHFSCVALTTKPKGKWFCPKCRGDRSNQMKPKH